MKHSSKIQQRQLLSGMMLLLLAFFGCIASTSIAYTGNMLFTKAAFFACTILVPIAYVLLWKCRYCIDNSIAQTLLFCHLVLGLFCVSLLINVDMNYAGINKKFLTLFLILSFGGMAFWIFVLRSSWPQPRKFFHVLWNGVRSNSYLIVLCLLLILLCIGEFSRGVKWDSADYYRSFIGLSSFSFSPTDIALFKKSGHLSYAYTFVYAIGYGLFPDHVFGVRLVTVSLFLITIVVFSRIINKVFKCEGIRNYAVTTIFAFTPLIFGPLHEINPEIAVVCFFACFAYSFAIGNKVSQTVFATLLVFCRETGIVALFFFFIGYVLYDCLLYRRNHEKASRVFFNWPIHFLTNNFTQILVFYVPCLLFLVHFLADPVTWGSNSASLQAGDLNQDILNTFGLNTVVVLTKIKQMFLMNFNWLLIAVLFLFAVFALLKNKTKLVDGLKSSAFVLVPIGCSYLGFCFMQFFYITFLFPRYVMLNSFILCLFLAFFVNVTFIKKIITSIICFGLSVLMLVQTFYTLDPVTKMIFKNIDIGDGALVTNSSLIAFANNNYIVETGQNTKIMDLSPYTYYNRQWGYFDNLMNNVLAKINYRESDSLVLLDSFSPNSIGPYWGWCSNNYYDPETKKIYQRYGNDRDYSHMERITYHLVDANKAFEVHANEGRIFYIQFPFNSDQDDLFLTEVSDFVATVSYMGWSASVFELEATNE